MKKLSLSLISMVGLLTVSNFSAFASKNVGRITENPEVTPIQAFQNKANGYAQKQNLYLADVWSVNLDKDAQMEQVALLCPQDKHAIDARAAYLVQKDEAHVWVLSFAIDNRTQIDCDTKPKSAPTPKQKQDQTISLTQGTQYGFQSFSFAIRKNKLVIVRTEMLEAKKLNSKIKVKNYDQLAKKGTPYPSFDKFSSSQLTLEVLNP